jgi:hypothetical protein
MTPTPVTVAMTNDSKQQFYRELFALSFVSLFVELLIIRWMSADIRAFTIFRTFPLITTFVGLGVGYSLRTDRMFRASLPWLLAFVISMKVAELTTVNTLSFISSDIFTFQYINFSQMNPGVLAFQIAVLLLLLATPFAACMAIGARLGVLFNETKPLPAYCCNLAGAIIGSVLFAWLSSMGLSPALLMLIPAALIAYFQISDLKTGALAVAAIAAIAAVPMWPVGDTEQQPFRPLQRYYADRQTFWSPYYEVDLRRYATNGAFIGLELSVNHRPQQYYFLDDLSLDHLSPAVQQFISIRREAYAMPFQIKKPRRVLILGAGTGQNVSAAVASGAESIDCVDIDPLVLDVGKKYNHSYSNPRVHQICDDARHFIATTHNKYDLVVYPILDSQTTVGQSSSVRTDSYVYTEQSFKQALQLMNPDGMIVVIYGTAKLQWLEDRLRRTLESAAGYAPLAIAKPRMWGNASIFLLGEAVANHSVLLPSGWNPVSITPVPANKPLTDDWPYLYVAPNFIDIPYWTIVLTILGLGTFIGRKILFSKPEGTNWQMFFLGAAFLLLELHAISLLSLVYGSTWMTSATTINGILVMIMIANLLVLKFEKQLERQQPAIYGALLASILASYLMPASNILNAFPGLLGTLIVTVVTLLPMCAAGVLFATAFARTPDASRAMAFNLLGAVLGGVLEYMSNFWGVKSLELLAAGLYLVSFACSVMPAGKPTAAVAPATMPNSD